MTEACQIETARITKLSDEELADELEAHGITRLAHLLRRPTHYRPCPDCSGYGGCAYGACP